MGGVGLPCLRYYDAKIGGFHFSSLNFSPLTSYIYIYIHSPPSLLLLNWLSAGHSIRASSQLNPITVNLKYDLWLLHFGFGSIP